MTIGKEGQYLDYRFDVDFDISGYVDEPYFTIEVYPIYLGALIPPADPEQEVRCHETDSRITLAKSGPIYWHELKDGNKTDFGGVWKEVSPDTLEYDLEQVRTPRELYPRIEKLIADASAQFKALGLGGR